MATLDQIAKHLFIVKRRLYELISDGVITRQGRGGYDLDFVREEYIRNLRAQAERAGRPPAPPAPVVIDEDRNRHIAARADLAELDLAAKRRDFVPADEVSAAIKMVITNMKIRLEAIPTRTAILVNPEKPAKAEKIISGQIRAALEDLAQVQVFPAPGAGDNPA